MIILQKGQLNELILNINNNSRATFSTYVLTFTNSLSKEVKTYTIDKSNPLEYLQNDRYCEIELDLSCGGCDLNYEGQYQLEIFGDGTTLVYTTLCRLDGNTENNTIVEYISNNEDDEKYVYIQD